MNLLCNKPVVAFAINLKRLLRINVTINRKVITVTQKKILLSRGFASIDFTFIVVIPSMSDLFTSMKNTHGLRI